MSSESGKPGALFSEHRRIILLVFGAALLGRLFALQSWWCLDDWGQLARAAGNLEPAAGLPARVLSQQWWWSLVWPLLGLNAPAHALLRMLLHSLAAVAVARLARRLGISSDGTLVAGLVFAATPVAFTVLYWASGIQELLAGVLAIWAVERWMDTGIKSVLTAGVLAVLSFLAKESGLGLPLLFLGMTLTVNRQSSRRIANWRWLMVAVLFLAATWEARLVLGHFATGQGDPYQTGPVSVALRNLGQFGVWLCVPFPLLPPVVLWPQAGLGFLFWGSWAAWGLRNWRRGKKYPLAALGAALLSLGPALPLVHQSKPYMGYVAVAALALVIGGLIPANWNRFQGMKSRIGVALLFAAYSLLGMGLVLRTGDPVVVATSLAKDTAIVLERGISKYSDAGCEQVAVFQQPLRPETVARADRLGPLAVRTSPRFSSMQGVDGLGLLVPEMREVFWVNSITELPPTCLVFCETGQSLETWGPCPDALRRAVVIDVLVGSRQRAAEELHRAVEMKAGIGEPRFDPKILSVSAGEFRRQSDRFLRWLVQAPQADSYTRSEKTRMAALLREIRDALESDTSR